jgi:hypothetical protein
VRPYFRLTIVSVGARLLESQETFTLRLPVIELKDVGRAGHDYSKRARKVTMKGT